MKAVKIFIGIVIAVIILIAIATTILFVNLNTIVKEAIETLGIEILDTRVNVNAVDIQLTEGKGAIGGLSIANPQGYSSNDLLKIGDVGLQLDIESLSKEVIVIKEVYIEGVTLLAEQKNIKDTNIQALVDNLSSSSSRSSSESSSSSSNSSEDVRLMVESLRVGETTIQLVSEKLGSRNLSLPAYSQNNIGDKSNGLTPGQLGKAIMSTMMQRAKSAISAELKSVAKERAKEEAKDKLKEKLGDKIDTDKIKSLFGR